MFSVAKSSLKSIPARLVVVLLLTSAGCVQTQERSSRHFISIDHSLTYGKAVHSNRTQAIEAARSDPYDPAPHYFLARSYLLQNNLDAAEAEFKIILRLSPDSDGAYYELARINMLKGDNETALLHLNRAVELNPGFADAHFALAQLHEKLGNSEKAKIHRKAYMETTRTQSEGIRERSK